MKEYQAYQVSKAGNLRNLNLITGELPPPQPNQVQVRISAIGLNFADIFAILGLYSATPEGAFIPGLEYAGVIEEVGNEVSGLKTGDRVMGVTRFGGYTSTLNIDATYVTKIPHNWNFEEGASFLVQAITAYYGLVRLGDLQAGNTVLIQSAAGGVGLLANRIAKKLGAYTIGAVGSAAKVDLLKEEGYDDYIVRSTNFKIELAEKLEGRELNLVMESVGGPYLQASYDLLAPMGRLINYGSARYGTRSDRPNWFRLFWMYLNRPKIDPQKMIELNKGILGFNLIWLYHNKALFAEVLKELMEFELPAPLVGHRYTFDELPQAIRHFQSGTTTGKVVITT